MSKPHITRTYSQIHFEDLDPRRFEDLIRQLMYDFKDWQDIEATGRGGSDDGFDIRAFEINYEKEPLDDDEEVVPIPLKGGNEWMIQCKREQSIGPSRIKQIIKENIDVQKPPYGYILAVACNVSKKTYDAFREILREHGVMEFYLWGKATLEDMLYLPKNDRILFTFFGISLTNRRRSRTTEVRSIVTIKNKLITHFKSNYSISESILVRDISDENYPYEHLYPDFKTSPRWKTYTGFQQHPLGLIVHESEYYAYYDPIKKEYDYTTFLDNAYVDYNGNDWHEKHSKLDKFLPFYDGLPSYTKATLFTDSIIKYKDIALVDTKGDSLNEKIHVFVNYIKGSPFSKSRQFIKLNGIDIEITDLKRIKIFPNSFGPNKSGVTHDKILKIDDETFFRIAHHHDAKLFAIDGRYDFLNSNDVVQLLGVFEGEEKNPKVTITCRYAMPIKELLMVFENDRELKDKLLWQLGKIPKSGRITVVEFKPFYFE